MDLHELAERLDERAWLDGDELLREVADEIHQLQAALDVSQAALDGLQAALDGLQHYGSSAQSVE